MKSSPLEQEEKKKRKKKSATIIHSVKMVMRHSDDP